MKSKDKSKASVPTITLNPFTRRPSSPIDDEFQGHEVSLKKLEEAQRVSREIDDILKERGKVLARKRKGIQILLLGV